MSPALALTERLELRAPLPDDRDQLFRIHRDPRVWTHFPSLRHAQIEQTTAMLDRWIAGWQRDGLSTWVVRLRGAEPIIGSGGCLGPC